MRAYLVLLVLFSLNLTQGFCQAELSAFEVDPHAIVANHVDATSGAWIEEEKDLFVSSREPFALRRYYSSEWGEWKVFPHCSLIQGSSSASTLVISTSESNGTPLRFVKSEMHKPFQYCVSGQNALCNTAHGPISRMTNYTNFTCTADEKRIVLTHPDGTVRRYENVSSVDLGPLCVPFTQLQNSESLQNISYFRLISEDFPTHASIQYRYDDKGRLSSLEFVHEPKQAGRMITFSYEPNSVHAALDSRRLVTYSYTDGNLVQVNRVQKPSIRYTYQNKLLVRKDYPQGRFQAISYDKNERVHALFGPLSNRHETASRAKEPLYTFHYEDGVTQVKSGLGHTLKFHHVNRLLQSIELCDDAGLYRRDHFVWSSDKPVSKLLGQTIHAKDGSVVWAMTNEYTNDGNLAHSKFYSVATEHPEHAITLDSNGLATGEPESETPNFLYKGHFGAIAEQNDGMGNFVQYTYKEGTTLLLERHERTPKEYKHRSFYKYDNATYALIQEIHDNGNEKIDRTILEIQPRSYPKTGLDEEVRIQKCYDLGSNSEKLVHRVRLLFDTDNNLVKKELYDTQDILAKQEDRTFDDHGNCTHAINAVGDLVFSTYDENDNCIRIEESISGRVTTIAYDLNNFPTSTTTTYRDGAAVTTSALYDSFGNKVVSIDRYGNCTEYGYDAFSRLISLTYPQVVDEYGIRIRPQQTFAYDIFDNVTMKTDPKGYIERYRYTSSGKLLRVDYADGSNEQFEYSGEKIKKISNRDETNTHYRYNNNKKLTAIETFSPDNGTAKVDCIFQQKFTYSYRNLCEEAQRPTGSFISRKYDVFGRVISETETTSTTPTGGSSQAIKTEYEYDSLHRPHRIKRWIDDKSFIVECLQYDCLDRVIERWIEEPDNTKTSHTICTYDIFGNRCETASFDSIERIEYIEGTRPHRIIHPDATVTRIDYNEQQYNALGQRFLEKIITDPAGIKTCATYDALGRQVQLCIKDSRGKMLASRQFFYDACNNLSATVVSKDRLNSIRTEWTYGPMQRLELLREAAKTDDAQETRYSYNNHGKLTQISRSDGTTFTYEYGNDGTLTKILNAKGEVISKFFFNVSGQFIGGESSEKVKSRRTYTPQGRITEETVEDAWGSYSCNFYYDGLGRMKLASLPIHKIIEFHYIGTRQTGVCKKEDYLRTVFQHEFTQWNAHGDPIEEKLVTGEQKSRTYTEGRALSSLTTPYFSQSILKRDQVGNPLSVECGKIVNNYSYNQLNQLVEEKNDTKKECYTYDLLGNIKQHNDTEYTSNALNQLSSNQLPCQYDKQGNLISSGNASFTYNDSNQLIEAKDTASGKSAQYCWDVYGRRISQVHDKSVRRFLYIGNSEVGAIDKFGTNVELKVPERVVGNEAFGAVYIELQNKSYLPISDLFGNIVKLVDLSTKNTLESYEYTAYGQETIQKEGTSQEDFAISNPWRYRGIRTDPLTKHVQFTFREYSPHLQHFLTRDPTGYADGPNLYSYALSNPLSYCDIDGLATRRGACLCHGQECEYYRSGTCGHGAGVIIEDDPPTRCNLKVTEWFDYEQDMAKQRELRNCNRPVNYSRSYDLQRESVPGRGLGFINGVANTFEDALGSATYISNLVGGKNVLLTYAATNGLPADLEQAGYNLYGFYATNATKILYDSWMEFFDSAGPDARFMQICHSWGAIHVRNALIMCKPEIRNRIDVRAYAPAAYIHRKYCRTVVHFINEDPLRDGIPRIDQAGLKMALSQRTVKKIKSHPKASFFDHSILSETLKVPLYENTNEYFSSQDN